MKIEAYDEEYFFKETLEIIYIIAPKIQIHAIIYNKYWKLVTAIIILA